MTPTAEAPPITVQRPKRAALPPAAPVQASPPPSVAPAAAVEPPPAPDPVPVVEDPQPDPAADPELVLALAPMEEAVPEPARLPVETKDRTESGKYKRQGFVLGTGFGPMGCTREVCSSSGHKAQTGVGLSGFAGYNIKGRVELGLLGGWGRMGSGLEENTSVLELYGARPGQVPTIAQALGLLPSYLYADDATLNVGHLAPVVRVHFPKTGRFDAYVGAGVGWSTFRARYTGGVEDFKLAFGGLDVPAQVGAMYYLSERVSVGANVDYRWTHWVTLKVDHPERSVLAPLRTVRDQAASNGLEFDPKLPHMWMASLALRLTL